MGYIPTPLKDIHVLLAPHSHWLLQENPMRAVSIFSDGGNQSHLNTGSTSPPVKQVDAIPTVCYSNLIDLGFVFEPNITSCCGAASGPKNNGLFLVVRLLSLDAVKRWGIKLAAFKQSEREITKGFCKTKAQCDILNRWVIFAWHPRNLNTVCEKDKPNNQSRLSSIYPVSMSTMVWILYFIHLLSIVGGLFFSAKQSFREKQRSSCCWPHCLCAF